MKMKYNLQMIANVFCVFTEIYDSILAPVHAVDCGNCNWS